MPDPALAAMMERIEHIETEVGSQFHPTSDLPSPGKTGTGPAKLPALSAGAAPGLKLAEANRWFDGLARTEQRSQAELDARRARLRKVGLDLIGSECRSGVCRLSFAYSGRSAEEIALELGGRDAARVREDWWSFTVFKPEGRVEGHVFIVGGKSHGGTR